MKKEDIYGALLISFIFFPWITGVVDLFCFILIGNKISGIPWGVAEGRTFVAMLWPIFVLLTIEGLS